MGAKECAEHLATKGFDIGAMPAHRFPPPWSVDETNGACIIVRDANGLALAYVSFEDEPGRRAAAKLLTRDEARRIAANIAKWRPRWSSKKFRYMVFNRPRAVTTAIKQQDRGERAGRKPCCANS